MQNCHVWGKPCPVFIKINMVEEIESHVLKRYDLLNTIGKGTYGIF